MKYRFNDDEAPEIDDVTLVSFVRQNEALYHAIRAAVAGEQRPDGSTPEAIIQAFRSAFNDKQECAVMVSLDGRTKVKATHLLSLGASTATVMDVRDVCHYAILDQARSVVLVHCHPSGDPKPSPADVSVTRRVKEALALLDVMLVDHIILGYTSYSFAAEGQI